MYGFELKTDVIQDMVIQELHHVLGDQRTLVIRHVLDVSDDEVRNALIRMGWTPPPDTRPKRRAS